MSNKFNLTLLDSKLISRVGSWFAETYADEFSYHLEDDLEQTAKWLENLINTDTVDNEIVSGDGKSMFGEILDMITDDVLQSRLVKLIEKIDGPSSSPYKYSEEWEFTEDLITGDE